MRTFTTESINKILKDYNEGRGIKRSNNIFYQGEFGTLRSDIIIVRTHDELREYIKCSIDIYYFIEKYCLVLTKDGIVNIKLREYQKEWIEMFIENRFSIYCTSRQTGYDTILALIYLHYLTFNNDKRILSISYKDHSSINFMDKIKLAYNGLPYFLKLGINSKNLYSINFNNGSFIRIKSGRSKIVVDDTYDIISYTDFSFIPENISIEQLNKIIILISSVPSSKLILQSVPNGVNRFYKMIIDSERKIGDPSKNNFKTIRTYWWEVPGRDEEWKKNEILSIGLESFNEEHDLSFISL